MFENAKIRRNLAEFRKKIEVMGDEVLFYPIKTIRDATHFHHLLRRLEGYSKSALEFASPLDSANLKREIAGFLSEVKREAKIAKSKHMKPHFEMLIVGLGALLELA